MEHLQNLMLCWATKQGISQSVFFNPNVLKFKKNKGSNKRYSGKNLHVFGNSKQLSTIKKINQLDIRKSTKWNSNKNMLYHNWRAAAKPALKGLEGYTEAQSRKS